jgi:hypothetical protein
MTPKNKIADKMQIQKEIYKSAKIVIPRGIN